MVTGEGLEALAAYLKPGETAVLVGSSGVGKSTLVNALAGEERMATAAIREQDAHGRHTTTHRELIRLPSGALVLDTPGMRELGLLDADEGLSTTFEDIEALAERVPLHRLRPHQRAGLRGARGAGGRRSRRRPLASFQKLQRELAHLERKEDPVAREAHRRHWIGIHKSARAHMKPSGSGKARSWSGEGSARGPPTMGREAVSVPRTSACAFRGRRRRLRGRPGWGW